MYLKIKIKDLDFTIVTNYTNKGIDKYSDQFDIEKYSRNLRHLNTLVLLLMTDNERVMNQFLYESTLNLSDEKIDSWNDEAFKIPDLLARQKSKKIMYSSRISDFIAKNFDSKISIKDYKLLNACFTSTPLSIPRSLNFNNPTDSTLSYKSQPSNRQFNTNSHLKTVQSSTKIVPIDQDDMINQISKKL